MSTLENHTEIRELLVGCLKAKRKSQQALYQMFYSYGMSVCIRYSSNREEAVEILNEGFMKIFQNLKKFDLSKPFKPWFRKILVNSAINNFKWKQRKFQEETMDYVIEDSGNEDILSGISYQEIIDMIQQLSPAYRTVFNLYVIEGYKHEEIADMLGISVGTSKSNLSKAKQNLREILKEFFREDYVKAR